MLTLSTAWHAIWSTCREHRACNWVFSNELNTRETVRERGSLERDWLQNDFGPGQNYGLYIEFGLWCGTRDGPSDVRLVVLNYGSAVRPYMTSICDTTVRPGLPTIQFIYITQTNIWVKKHARRVAHVLQANNRRPWTWPNKKNNKTCKTALILLSHNHATSQSSPQLCLVYKQQFS